MVISDFFSTSFLFSIAIIIILIGGMFAYVSYRMGEQDHKLTSMVNLVSILAQDLQFVNNKLASVENEPKLQYSSKIIGGECSSDLISVSDEGDDYNDDEYSKDDDIEDEDIEDEDIEDDDNEDDDIEDDDTDGGKKYIKRVNLTLTNEGLNVKIPYEEIDIDNDSYNEANNLEFDSNQDLKDFILKDVIFTLKDTDIQDNKIILSNQENTTSELNEDKDFLKNVSITDFGESLGEADESHTVKYKKMSLNKLREVAVSKGVIVDASKLKKPDILKLLGDD